MEGSDSLALHACDVLPASDVLPSCFTRVWFPTVSSWATAVTLTVESLFGSSSELVALMWLLSWYVHRKCEIRILLLSHLLRSAPVTLCDFYLGWLSTKWQCLIPFSFFAATSLGEPCS